MNVEIGKKIRQMEGFSAFIPHSFPPKGLLHIPQDILLKAALADRTIGKLDGITHVLPDISFFLNMFALKEAEASSHIEGTKATILDAFEQKIQIASKKTDADDLLYYIKALNYGLRRLKEFPLALRLIRDLHKILMTGARSTHFSDPGEFRRSQNYIGGTKPSNASFVPPPIYEMNRSLDHFEKFLYEKQTLPLIHIGISHAQFETIHPFLDGNGRTGRLMISLLLYHKKLLEKPVLFLSSWFRKHQNMYYQKLNDYRNGKVENWMRFFLDAVIETAEESINVSKKIRKLRDQDMEKIQALAKREAESGVKMLSHLFKNPVVTTRSVMNWTGFTRAGAQKAINRFTDLGILQPHKKEKMYDKSYIYKKYINAFQK